MARNRQQSKGKAGNKETKAMATNTRPQIAPEATDRQSRAMFFKWGEWVINLAQTFLFTRGVFLGRGGVGAIVFSRYTIGIWKDRQRPQHHARASLLHAPRPDGHGSCPMYHWHLEQLTAAKLPQI